MKLNKNKKVLTFLLLSFATALAFAETKSPAAWHSEFTKLSSGMARLEAEKEIASVRKVKSTYDLWAMDTSSVVAYKLDGESILVVRYKPGAPAPRTNQGHLPPIDGSVIDYEVLQLR